MGVETYLLIGFGIFVVGVGFLSAWMTSNTNRCFGPPRPRPLSPPRERPKESLDRVTAAAAELCVSFDRVTVNAAALRRVLEALNGQGHLIRELQCTRNIDKLTGIPNPIDVLVGEYDQQADAYNKGIGEDDEQRN